MVLVFWLNVMYVVTISLPSQNEPLQALAHAGTAPTLRQPLAKIIPAGWAIHYDMGLKPEVRRPLT
ncbi:hypothetical protein DFT97_004226 [Salmonella enterica subsp. enterica serovar Newport]|nr:hypothetical protein [Salmonella enterica subsp. enterica serovar Newport]